MTAAQSEIHSILNSPIEALDAGLPADLRAIVQQQYGEVQAAHDVVKRLRDAAKK